MTYNVRSGALIRLVWCHAFLYLPFLFSDKGEMSCLDEVPFKIPLGFLGEAKEEIELLTAPEITLPDYLKILQETEV